MDSCEDQMEIVEIGSYVVEGALINGNSREY